MVGERFAIDEHESRDADGGRRGAGNHCFPGARRGDEHAKVMCEQYIQGGLLRWVEVGSEPELVGVTGIAPVRELEFAARLGDEAVEVIGREAG